MPIALLVTQAIIVTLFSFVFLVMPTVSSAYWILNAMISELYLIMYILMFSAAIKLRYKYPSTHRPYKIPGGNWGMWMIAGLGLIASCFALFVGFFPPAQLATGNPVFYVGFLILGVALTCAAPSLILCFKKPSWTTN